MYALMHKKKNNKGFTLIELIVVVAILAILAAVAVPTFLTLRGQAEDSIFDSDVSTLCGAINVYNASNEGKITKTSDDPEGTLSGAGLLPVFDTNSFDEIFAAVVWTDEGVAVVHAPAAGG